MHESYMMLESMILEGKTRSTQESSYDMLSVLTLELFSLSCSASIFHLRAARRCQLSFCSQRHVHSGLFTSCDLPTRVQTICLSASLPREEHAAHALIHIAWTEQQVLIKTSWLGDCPHAAGSWLCVHAPLDKQTPALTSMMTAWTMDTSIGWNGISRHRLPCRHCSKRRRR